MVRYHMRKINADNRPRVKGRFVKASALPDLRGFFMSEPQQHELNGLCHNSMN
jgi:CCT motif